jgi:hypothetical protein
VICPFLNLAYLTQYDDLQFHPFYSKQHNFTLYDWVILHCIHMPHGFYSFICWWADSTTGLFD